MMTPGHGAVASAAHAGPAPALVWINGQAVDREVAHVSALDRGLTLADGVFETMRLYHARAFRLDAHLGRLCDACIVLRINEPPGLHEMATRIIGEAARAGLGDARLRLTITRGVGTPGLAPPPAATPTIIVAVTPLPPYDATPYESGITAHFASGRLNERAMTTGLKTLSYTDAVLALAEAMDAGADDAIILDTRDHLAEATTSNLFLVTDNMLVTPPLSCGVLPGITRSAVFDCAGELGVATSEQELTPNDLERADEAFLTSSVREIVPLVRIEGTAVGSGRPGSITGRIMRAYAELVRRECGS